MPHAICVILFLNVHTYRFVLPLHVDKTLSQGVNNTIRIPALKKEDGENQRNSIILPSQEVRHIRFRRLSPPVKLPIKLSNEKISRAWPRIVLAWRNYYFSQDFFALAHISMYTYSSFSRPEGAYFAFKTWFLKIAAMKTWGFMRESVFSRRGSSKILGG